MVESNRSDELKLEPQVLQQIDSQVSEHVDPAQLTSIAPETSVNELADKTIICFVCKRLPIEPTTDENCDSIFCKPCIAKQPAKICPVPSCQSTFKEGRITRLAANVYQALNLKCVDCG